VANSTANPSQPAAAAIIGPDPGPIYIRPELISGGNAAKSNTASSSIGRDCGGNLGYRVRTFKNYLVAASALLASDR
jgi:hypothetical protein